MRRSHVLAVTAIVLAAVSACGSAEQPQTTGGDTGEVATLKSATATTAAATAATKAPERPRERLDTTSDEFEALLGPYNKCMRENGADFGKAELSDNATGAPGPADLGQIKPGTAEEEAKFDAAQKICEPQYYPLPPWEKDPANPEARDFAVAVVKCLKKRDVEYVAVSDDGISIALGGDDNDPRSIRLGMDLLPECERQVAAAMK
jgi:hypothetical protein